MKNGENYIDDKGRKWVWINTAYYIDDMTIEDAKNRICNITREDYLIVCEILKVENI